MDVSLVLSHHFMQPWIIIFIVGYIITVDNGMYMTILVNFFALANDHEAVFHMATVKGA